MVTRVEVIALVTAYVQSQYKGDWQEAFTRRDKDGDGKLGRNELISLLRDAEVGTWLWRPEIADSVIAEMDGDGDGQISWDEFQRAFNRGEAM